MTLPDVDAEEFDDLISENKKNKKIDQAFEIY